MQAGMIMADVASALGIRTEEASLVADLKAGSEEAFALLIAQYHQPIYSLIARSLNDPSDAPDITQEVFIKVFRSIRSFNGDASLRTWLYRIALHEASNQRRWWSRHKRQEITIDAPNECEDTGDSFSLASTLADRGESPFEQAAKGELRSRVESALRELPEAFRSVVVLREIEAFSYEEIAEILDVNIGTVKSRLTRGRAALRSLLIAQEAAAKCFSNLESKTSADESKNRGDSALNSLLNNPEYCERVRASFSEYLDCAVSGREMYDINAHLEACVGCKEEFASWREMQQALGTLRAPKVPVDMGLKLRVAISQVKARQNRRWTDRFAVSWDNAFRPLLIQASAGFAGTIVLIGSIVLAFGMVAAPEAVMAHDVPLGAVTAPPLPLLRSQRAADSYRSRHDHRRRGGHQRCRSGVRL